MQGKHPYTHKKAYFEKGKINFLDLFAKAIGGPRCITSPGKTHRNGQVPQIGCWQQATKPSVPVCCGEPMSLPVTYGSTSDSGSYTSQGFMLEWVTDNVAKVDLWRSVHSLPGSAGRNVCEEVPTPLSRSKDVDLSLLKPL